MRTTTTSAGLTALLAVAAMQLPDTALAGSLLPKAGTKTLGTPRAGAPSWHEHSGDFLVHAYLKRRTETEKKEFHVNPDHIRRVGRSCMAKPRSAPDRRMPSREGVRRIVGCKSWTCTKWYAPLNCCVRWDCSMDVFR
jgi:hypothetical protein